MSVLAPTLAALVAFAGALLVLSRRETAVARRRVNAYVVRQARRPDVGAESDRPARARLLGDRIDACVRRLPFWPRVARLVDRAAPSVPATRFAYACLAGALLVVLGALAAGLPPAAAAEAGVAALAAVRLALGLAIARRRRLFEEQLPEVLDATAAALRAGHGLNQALQAVAADTAEPAASELRRVLVENRLGRSLEEALADVAARLGSRELDFVVDAVVVQRQVGGSLAGIFEIVSESVRQRQQFALRIRTLTAVGRMSAQVVVALPVLLAVLLTLLHHSYLSPLLDRHSGRVLLVAAVALAAVGALWLRQVVRFRG